MSGFGEMHVRSRTLTSASRRFPADLANACVVIADRRPRRGPRPCCSQRCETDPALSRAIRAGAARDARSQCLGPLAVESIGCGVPGLLLAGDAAGFIDPMTGDGLHFALRGAELAAAEVLDALAHGRTDPHLRLAVVRRQEFARKWLFNRTLRSLVGSPLAVRAAALGAKWSPRWLHQTIRYAGDLAGKLHPWRNSHRLRRAPAGIFPDGRRLSRRDAGLAATGGTCVAPDSSCSSSCR